jgi:ribosomal protein L37AE/L43A
METDIEFVQLELKYCERCGALWVRLSGSEVVFCGACAREIAGLFPTADGDVQANEAGIFGLGSFKGAFWVEGGNA